MSARDSIRKTLQDDGLIPAELLLGWMQSNDLETLGAAERLLREHRARLDGPVGQPALREFLLRYFRRCLRENPQGSEFAEDRGRAAHSLCRWFFALLDEEPVPRAALDGLKDLLAELYRTGDPPLRETIVAHCLEHLFESPRVVALFADWEDDPALGAAYQQALEWGEGFWPRRYR